MVSNWVSRQWGRRLLDGPTGPARRRNFFGVKDAIVAGVHDPGKFRASRFFASALCACTENRLGSVKVRG